MIEIQTDNQGQRYIEWAQTPDNPAGFKRAWIQRKTDPDKNWAGTVRYLNVVRIDRRRPGSGGAPTDFPIFLPEEVMGDDQILEAFVASVCAITGCRLP